MPMEIRKTACTCGVTIWDKRTEHETYVGQVIVCIYCGQLLQLGADLVGVPVVLDDLGHLNAQERRDVDRWQRLAKLLAPYHRAQLAAQRKRGS